jgi:hypothetical protein
MSETLVHVPPLPVLRWDSFCWSGEVVLATWAGFQALRGGYGAISGAAPSDGSVLLNVDSPDENARAAPSHAQATAFQYLLDAQVAVQTAILKSLLQAYPAMRARYDYPPEEAQLMPEVRSPEQFRELIGLSTLHILAVAKGGCAYVGFELGCLWDEEHGLGLLTHQERVVDLGGADTAFLGWNAETDARGGSP